MIKTLTTLYPLMFTMPILSLTMSRSNFLMCLLNLEALSLGMLSFILLVLFNSSHLEPMNALIILTMGACEASLGLSCLINMMRSYGNDNISSINSVKC